MILSICYGNFYKLSGSSVCVIPFKLIKLKRLLRIIRDNFYVTIIIHVPSPGSLDVPRLVEDMLFPGKIISGVLAPPQILAKPAAGYIIRPSISIDIQRDRRKIVPILPVPRYISDIRPVQEFGTFIPERPGNNIELFITIYVKDPNRFIALGLYLLFLKLNRLFFSFIMLGIGRYTEKPTLSEAQEIKLLFE